MTLFISINVGQILGSHIAFSLFRPQFIFFFNLSKRFLFAVYLRKRKTGLWLMAYHAGGGLNKGISYHSSEICLMWSLSFESWKNFSILHSTEFRVKFFHTHEMRQIKLPPSQCKICGCYFFFVLFLKNSTSSIQVFDENECWVNAVDGLVFYCVKYIDISTLFKALQRKNRKTERQYQNEQEKLVQK